MFGFFEGLSDDEDQRNIPKQNHIGGEDLRLNSALRPEPFQDAKNSRSQLMKNNRNVNLEIHDWHTARKKLCPFFKKKHGRYELCYDFPRLQASILREINVGSSPVGLINLDLILKMSEKKAAAAITNRQAKALGLERDLETDRYSSETSSRHEQARSVALLALFTHVETHGTGGRLLDFWNHAFDVYPATLLVGNFWFVKAGKCTFVVETGSVVRMHFLYGDALRSLVDLISQRHLALEACNLALDRSLDHYPASSELSTLFDAGDKLIEAEGNSAYSGLKFWEPVVVGQLLSLSEQDCGILNRTEFRDKMISDLKDTGLAEAVIDDLISPILSTQSPNRLAQFFGLFRLWGHPLVDAAEGIKKVKEVGQIPKRLERETVVEITCMFKEIFCTNYYAKNNMWPSLSCPTHFVDPDRVRKSSAVFDAINGRTSLNLFSPDYDLLDWQFVTSKLTFEPEAHLSTIGLLADKAAGLKRGKIEEGLKTHGKIPADDSRRVLLNFLKEEGEEICDVLKRIDNEGLSEEDTVIGVTPKEREMKTAPRLFSLMTDTFRKYITATEKLIADCILPYFPPITMKDSGSMLVKKMCGVTSGMVGKKLTTRVVINSDFVKWNLHQRHDLVKGVFEFMDGLFGYNRMILRTHEIFEQSTFYSADNILIPTLEEFQERKGPYCWGDHYGGMEGLRQKGWTLVTSAALCLVARKCGVAAEILGQGDNQVIVLTISNKYKTEHQLMSTRDKEYIRSKYLEFMREMNDMFEKLGLPLKTEETWSSTSLFAYGKVLYYEGKALSMSLKKIVRSFFTSNEDFPSFSNQIAGVFACSVASAESDVDPRLSYEMALREVMRCHKWSLIWSPTCPRGFQEVLASPERMDLYLKDGKEVIRRDLGNASLSVFRNTAIFAEVTSLVNASLGGYASQNLYSLMVKSFPDRAYLSLAMIVKYLSTNDDVSPKVQSMLRSYLSLEFKEECDYSQLAQDPSAINILRPIQAKNFIKQGARGLISSSYVNNKVVKALAEVGQEEFKDSARICAKMRPLVPRLLSTIMEASVPGMAESLLASFEKTSTVQKIARTRGATLGVSADTGQIELRLQRAEVDFVKYFIYCCTRAHDIPSLNTYDLVEYWRKKSWKEPTLTGVTTPPPFSFLTCVEQLGRPCNLCTSEYTAPFTHVRHSSDFIANKGVLQTKKGPYMPYLGSDTRQKTTVKSDYVFECKSKPLNCAMDILRCGNWLWKFGSDFGNDMIKRVASLTDVPTNILVTDVMNCESSAVHRMDDSRVAHGGAPNFIPTFLSHTTCSTNSMGRYAKGSQNHPIHYQQLMVFSQAISVLRRVDLKRGTQVPYSYHFHVTEPAILPPLEESVVDYPEEVRAEVEAFAYKSYPSLPTLYATLEKARPKNRAMLKPVDLAIELENQTRRTQQGMRSLIVSQVVLRHIMSSTATTSSARSEGRKLEYVWIVNCNPLEIIKNVAAGLIGMACEEEGCRPLNLGSNADYFGLCTVLERACDSSHRMVSNLSDHALSPLADLYLVKESRNLIHGVTWMVSSSELILSMDKAKGYMRENLKRCIERYRNGTYQLPNYVPFLFSLVGSPLTPRDVAINFTYCCVLRLQDSEGFRHQAIQAMRERIYHVATGELTVEKKRRLLDAVLREAALWSLPRDLLDKKGPDFELKQQIVKDCLVESALQPKMIKQSVDSSMKILVPMKCYRPSQQQDASLLLEVPLKTTNRLARLSLDGTTTQVFSFKALEEPGAPCPSITPHRHALRPVVVGTTACYKYAGILRDYYTSDLKGINCMCLGDGIGGWSAVLTHLLEVEVLFFNSLLAESENSHVSLTDVYPPGLEKYGHLRTKVLGINNLISGCSDLTDERFAQGVVEEMKERKISVLTCDAEGEYGEFNKPWKMMINFLRICQSSGAPDMLAVFKTYASRKDHVILLSRLALSFFEDVDIVRSNFSSALSTEIFLVMRTKRNALCKLPFVDVGSDGSSKWVVTGMRGHANWEAGDLGDQILPPDFTRGDLLMAQRMSRVLLKIPGTTIDGGWGEVLSSIHAPLDIVSVSGLALHLGLHLKGSFKIHKDPYPSLQEHHRKPLSHQQGENIFLASLVIVSFDRHDVSKSITEFLGSKYAPGFFILFTPAGWELYLSRSGNNHAVCRAEITREGPCRGVWIGVDRNTLTGKKMRTWCRRIGAWYTRACEERTTPSRELTQLYKNADSGWRDSESKRVCDRLRSLLIPVLPLN